MNINNLIFKFKSTNIGARLADYVKYNYPSLWYKLKSVIVSNSMKIPKSNMRLQNNVFVDSFLDRIKKRIE